MKIREVKQLILHGLAGFAESNNFKIKLGDFALSTRAQNPKYSIFFTYITWGFEINLFPYVSVDFHEINEICSVCGFNLNHSAFINLMVLEQIVESGWNSDLKWQMQYDRKDRLIITDEDSDWETVSMNKIVNLLPYAQNYMKEFSTISAIDKCYNLFPIDYYNPNCSGLDTHCIVGIISAKLSNNPLYNQIKDAYCEIVKNETFTKEMKHSFFHIVDYLDK